MFSDGAQMLKKTNSLDTLSKATGMSKDGIRTIFEEVKADLEVLKACPEHDFQPQDEDNRLSDCTCTRCGGTVRRPDAMWYKRGFDHGVRSETHKEKETE